MRITESPNSNGNAFTLHQFDAIGANYTVFPDRIILTLL